MLDKITWLKDGKHRKPIMLSLANKPMLPSELAKELNIDPTTISRVLRELKAKGFIESISKESRTVSYLLTQEGRKIIGKI